GSRIGSTGASRLAPMRANMVAVSTHTVMRRRWRLERRLRPRGSAAFTAGVMGVAERSSTSGSVRDALVDEGVRDLDEQVDQHDGAGRDEDDGLHHGVVALQHRLHELAADAGPGE